MSITFVLTQLDTANMPNGTSSAAAAAQYAVFFCVILHLFIDIELNPLPSS